MAIRLTVAGILLAWLAALSLARAADPSTIHLDGVELSYIEAGRGEPVILLHGALGDYSAWAAQMGPFSQQYHVISYSRRYSFPNANAPIPDDYSVSVDASDLTKLLDHLKLQRVHLVGQSYGAYTALVFALAHPDRVRSLVLSEPPAHGLVRGTPEGNAAYEHFMREIWNPATRAFREGDVQQAMRAFVDGLAGASRFDQLPADARESLMRNAYSVEAATRSPNPFGVLSESELRTLRIPTLLVTGRHTITIHRLVNEELARLLPDARHVVVEKAGHNVPRENPSAFNEAALRFLADR